MFRFFIQNYVLLIINIMNSICFPPEGAIPFFKTLPATIAPATAIATIYTNQKRVGSLSSPFLLSLSLLNPSLKWKYENNSCLVEKDR